MIKAHFVLLILSFYSIKNIYAQDSLQYITANSNIVTSSNNFSNPIIKRQVSFVTIDYENLYSVENLNSFSLQFIKSRKASKLKAKINYLQLNIEKNLSLSLGIDKEIIKNLYLGTFFSLEYKSYTKDNKSLNLLPSIVFNYSYTEKWSIYSYIENINVGKQENRLTRSILGIEHKPINNFSLGAYCILNKESDLKIYSSYSISKFYMDVSISIIQNDFSFSFGFDNKLTPFLFSFTQHPNLGLSTSFTLFKNI